MRAWRTRACRLSELFAVPNSVQAITPLVGQILVEQRGAAPAQGEPPNSTSSTTAPAPAGAYAPVSQRLLPLDEAWRRELADGPGRRECCPRSWGGGTATLRGAHPRVSLRLALPGLRRIAGEREREPPGGDGTRRQEHRRVAGGPAAARFHRLRQSGIDEELFDVISGFEALTAPLATAEGKRQMKIDPEDFRVHEGERWISTNGRRW